MGLVRIIHPHELRGSHVLLLALFAVALAGVCLLTSAGKPAVLPDGAVEWDPDSILLALVEILDLQYAQPTPQGVAIKRLVHGAAAGLALLIVVAGWVAWSRQEAESETGDTVVEVADAGAGAATQPITRRQLNSIRTAQVMLLLYVLWSHASWFWADAPAYARGGAWLLTVQAVWAFALGFGFNRRAAGVAGWIMLAVLALTGLLAVAYHAQRNPTLRASYPIGNPIFLASCLLPGCLLAGAGVARGAAALRTRRPLSGAGIVLLALAALGIVGYGFWLTRSRGPAVGLAIALAAVVFLVAGRRVRWVVAGLCALGLTVGGWYLFSQRFAETPTGRAASMRVRFYAWPYAIDLFQSSPLRGIGEGGYALAADTLAVADVVDDPIPLERRIGHAHNEWLEVAANLGVVGFVLLLGTLLLTLHGGGKALARMPAGPDRAMLITLMAALVGLMVAECFGVALRFESLPLIFYAVVGMIWALAGPAPDRVLPWLGKHKSVQGLAVVLALAGCMTLLEVSRRDFAAARAGYDVAGAFDAGDYEQAERLAEIAARDRLSPQRKLFALRQLVSTRMQLAGYHQDQFLRRMRLATTGAGLDPRLVQEARTSRSASVQQITQGLANLADLVAVAPTVFHAGSLAYGFRQLELIYARVDEDAPALEQYRQAAAHALRTELARRPFEGALAARCVMLDFDALSPAEACLLLARPLRLHRPDPIYFDVVSRLVADADAAAALMGSFDGLAAQPVAAEVSAWPDAWAPEALRLAAIAAYALSDLPRAVTYLERAVEYYDLGVLDAPLARAAVYAELADAYLSADALAPERAVAAAETALMHAPRSQEGRMLADQVRRRLVIYQLAADHEALAAQYIGDLHPNATKPEQAVLMADYYVQLAYSVFEQLLNRDVDRLRVWRDRALALAPEAAPSWFLAGDVAVHLHDEDATVAAAKQAAKFGGDARNVLALLDRGLAAMPASERLQTMHAALASQIEKATGPADASAGVAPAAPPPAAVLPPAGSTSSALGISTNGAPVSTNGAPASTNGR
jgi:O-antigen ligase